VHGGRVTEDVAYCVYAAKEQRFMLGDAHGPEEGLRHDLCCVPAVIFFHPTNEEQKAFSSWRTGGNALLQKIFFTPEGLTAVDHDLGLGAQAVEKNGGGKNDSLSLPQFVIDIGHVVRMYATSRLCAAATVLARLHPHDVELEDAYTVTRFPQGLERSFQ